MRSVVVVVVVVKARTVWWGLECLSPEMAVNPYPPSSATKYSLLTVMPAGRPVCVPGSKKMHHENHMA